MKPSYFFKKMFNLEFKNYENEKEFYLFSDNFLFVDNQKVKQLHRCFISAERIKFKLTNCYNKLTPKIKELNEIKLKYDNIMIELEKYKKYNYNKTIKMEFE